MIDWVLTWKGIGLVEVVIFIVSWLIGLYPDNEDITFTVFISINLIIVVVVILVVGVIWIFKGLGVNI